MKRFLIKTVLLLFALSSSCQSTKNVLSDSLKRDLVDFLITKGEIRDADIEKFRTGKYTFHVIGIINGYEKSELIDGIYFFSSGFSHSKTFYLIVENSKHTILDMSNRDGLDISIKRTLDFCESKRYCSDITEDYIGRILSVYYTVNKNPIKKVDINCETGIKETKDLP